MLHAGQIGLLRRHSFTTLDVPGATWTEALGINDSGNGSIPVLASQRPMT